MAPIGPPHAEWQLTSGGWPPNLLAMSTRSSAIPRSRMVMCMGMCARLRAEGHGG
jgi:hypothetical protein